MKKRSHPTKKPSSRVIGTLRIHDLEKKVRKPSAPPGQRFKSKKAYNRSAKKREDRGLSSHA